MDIVGMDNNPNPAKKKRIILSIVGAILAIAIIVPVSLFVSKKNDSVNEDIINESINAESENTVSKFTQQELDKINKEENSKIQENLLDDLDLGSKNSDKSEDQQLLLYCEDCIVETLNEINNNIEKELNKDTYNSIKLKVLLQGIEKGEYNSYSSINMLTYDEWCKIIGYWLDVAPNLDFDNYTQEDSTIFYNIVKYLIYKEDFSNIENARIMDNYENMNYFNGKPDNILLYFSCNNKNYIAHFSIVNMKPKLLDIERDG